MSPSNPRVLSVRLDPEVARELAFEARRTDRTPSRLFQYAWRLARKEIRELAPVPRGFT
jgi:hypothetical protein